MNHTFYASDEDQLNAVLTVASDASIDDEFIAKTAVYAREKGFMKDMPALLCAILAARKSPLLETVFPRVIDNAKMLRNFVQIVRSGVTGRKSFGSVVRRLIRNWFEQRTDAQLFTGSIGNKPSMADIIKMVHPRPTSPEREAILAYLIGKPYKMELLPPVVRQFEQFKAGETTEVPNIPFQFLTSLNLSTNQWTEIARHASWQTTRMNLNTFARHGVFPTDSDEVFVTTQYTETGKRIPFPKVGDLFALFFGTAKNTEKNTDTDSDTEINEEKKE